MTSSPGKVGTGPSRAAHSVALRRHWERPPAAETADGWALRPTRDARLHLGCGDVRLSGYLNVDLPGGGRDRPGPDLEADVRRLHCPSDSLAEIRLHHVFEHFDRVEALALLLRWYEWLEPNGTLVVETPDFDTCVAAYQRSGEDERALILRHLFGSHEADWAVHRDGWSAARFRNVLEPLGYEIVDVASGASDESGLLTNVSVSARRPRAKRSRADRLFAATEILERSMNGRSESELAILARWEQRLESLLGD